MNNFSNLREQFTNKENLNLLWNVLLDEFNINNSNKKLINNIKIVFESNINPFILKANPRSNIMELNKLFLSQVVLAVNKLLSNNNTSHNNIFKKIISFFIKRACICSIFKYYIFIRFPNIIIIFFFRQ